MSLTFLGVQKTRRALFMNFGSHNIQNVFRSETRFAGKLKTDGKSNASLSHVVSQAVVEGCVSAHKDK